jgi:hypothetical protein
MNAREKYKMVLGSRERPMCEADNLTAVFGLIV